MNYYLIPLAPVALPGGETINASKYFLTDLKNLSVTAIPFGREGLALVGLAIATLDPANLALMAEPDVYTFPALYGAPTAIGLPPRLLTPADVATLAGYLGPFNVPTNWITAGMAFRDVLRRLTQIFLVAQFVSGKIGSAIFTGSITPSTTLATANASLALSAGPSPTPPSLLPTTTPGDVFNLSQVDPAQTLGDILVGVGQQFTDPIYLNEGVL